MSTKEIVNMTATEMVDSIKSKSLSASEVMDAHLAQIDLVNPKALSYTHLTLPTICSV